MTDNRRAITVEGVTLKVPVFAASYNYDVFVYEIIEALKTLRSSLNRREYRAANAKLFEAFLLDDKLTYQTKSHIAVRFRTHNVCNRWNLENLKGYDLKEYMRRSFRGELIVESICKNRELNAGTVDLLLLKLRLEGSKKFVLMLIDEALNPTVINELFLLAERRGIKDEVRERMVKFYNLDPAIPYAWVEKIAEGETSK